MYRHKYARYSRSAQWLSGNALAHEIKERELIPAGMKKKCFDIGYWNGLWCRGLYFRPKMIFIPPPLSGNDIFFPSRDTSFFDSHCGVFALILPYFAIILPFYFPFSHFLSPFLLFPSPFFIFLLHFPLFLFTFSYFFPQMTSADIFPPPRGGRYFPINYI